MMTPQKTLSGPSVQALPGGLSMLADADRQWLDDRADALDADASQSAAVIPYLAQTGLLGRGLPQVLGGQGGAVSEAVEAIAQVAEHSLAAAFAFWGQRVLIHLLAETDNAGLRERCLPALLRGDVAGASGLSNVMKFLSGIEALGIRATSEPGGGWRLDGSVPWCTNLRAPDFLVAVAVARGDGAPPMVVALPSDRLGLARSPDLDLMALRGSNTAALQLQAVAITADDLLAERVPAFLPRVRPAFLGMQCGMSIGLARAACAAAARRMGGAEHVLSEPLAGTRAALAAATAAIREGVDSGEFAEAPQRLFALRLALHDCVQQAMQLELQATGGRAYHLDAPGGFARRWRESAFIPIVTPSVTQLLGELKKHGG